jgi:hypothetical protein
MRMFFQDLAKGGSHLSECRISWRLEYNQTKMFSYQFLGSSEMILSELSAT